MQALTLIFGIGLKSIHIFTDLNNKKGIATWTRIWDLQLEKTCYWFKAHFEVCKHFTLKATQHTAMAMPATPLDYTGHMQ